ncbi:MAG: acyl-CoA dehydrogenase [Saprospiraceae bacterium]|nr:acyl-CoA dehydrogenase [Saprospiraceae bacterium]
MEFHSVLREIEQFVKSELYPLESQVWGQGWKDIYPVLDEKRAMVKNRGLWIPQIPVQWGGLGLSLHEFGQVSAVLGRSPFGHYCFNCQAPDAGNMEILIEFGTPSQQELYLKPLLEGKIRSCFSMTEPNHAGSNPVHMSTEAKLDGDDYVVSGHKWFTSGADGAAFAIVMVNTDAQNENKYERASQILVPADTPGFNIIRNISVMGEVGSGWASHSEIKYDHCRVPQANVLGVPGAGFRIAQQRLGPGRIHHCMRWVGICERAFEMMCTYAARRELSPGRVLASQQSIQNWIAESRAEINAARLMVLDAARKIDREGQYKSRIEISIIKFFCANVLQKVLDRAIQVHGALGMTDDTILASWYRHERAARIYDGPDEVHKSRVARLVLKEYDVKI